ncbi:hypothetical protein E4T52_13104 [Aureobasidium sp. EXF-3400]|nr:hypothetical protein E4T51_12069 [Aureobasidium sp. EXF-12344]KAI4771909.1 hypothetical protein E4T52_13104 [Aureobasidium sp. EXF-3400]
MEDYGLVSSDPPWRWIVQKPCFVSWSDQDEGPLSLGQLSPVNSTSKLTVNIGWRTDELLIALHLPVSTRGSKYPRDFFMIIPCDFDTSIVDATFAPVQADERLENADLGDCNLFRIPFQLAVPCDVIMPREKRRKPVKGTPRELISRLKSLSETSSFDVYFRFDTYAQLELRKIFHSLVLRQLKTPTIPLDSMYGGYGGGVNLWLDQGLDLDLDGMERQHYYEPSQEELPLPPPYTRDIIPPLELSQILSPKPLVDVQVPCSDTGVGLVSKNTDSDGEGVPETPFWARMQRILDYRSPSLEDSRRGSFKRAASVDSLPGSRREKQIRAFRSPVLGTSRRKASAPVVVGASAHHEINSSHVRSREVASPDLVPVICDAPISIEADTVAVATSHGIDSTTSLPAEKLEDSSWRPFASTPASLSVDWDAERTLVVHRDASESFDRAEEIALWLYSAWSVLPSAHHILRPQLLALGAAQNADSFAKVRVDCSTRLALTAARATQKELNKPLLEEVSDVEEQIREVVTWINGVRCDADTTLVYDLAALAGAAMDVVDSVLEKEEKMGRFLVQKARCIALACVLRDATTIA